MIDDSIPITIYIGQALHFLGLIGLVVAASILLYKKRSTPTILIFIGAILSFLAFFGSFAANYLAAQHGAETVVKMQGYIGTAGGIIYLILISGFIWLGISLKKNR
ncbi:hypothetical protein ABN763_00300 [Spongiivirga sp. MCCC 1A20706]|uniref:hypothetical protein n=1 Tax=Spongiivirga sp. MCCC 1A20706 TaxID=3160963 RepID=UPI003977542D